MPAIVTSNFRIRNAKAFVDSFDEAANGGRGDITGQSYVYLFIGKILSWDKTHAGYNDIVVPTPDGDVQGNEFEPWRDMIAAVRVTGNTDISFGAKRYDWTSGEVYTAYDDQDPTITKATTKFYVYEALNGAVFKCLDNNGGAASTVRPTIPSPVNVPFVTIADGYRWKYMYSIPTGVSTKFLSTNYIPVRTLNASPRPSDGATELLNNVPVGYDNQALIQTNANNGSIETYVVIDGGSGFTAHSGSFATTTISSEVAPNTTFVVLDSDTNLQGTNDFYNGAAIFIANSSVQKGVAIIGDYGTLGIAGGGTQVRSAWLSPGFAAAYAPAIADTYSIAPRVEVAGDGQAANAYAICSTSGTISQINALASGNNYTTANVYTVGGSGSGVVARAIIPPPHGHGSDPISELNGYNIIVAKTLNGAGDTNLITGTGNTLPISNQYRTVGLVRNPYLRLGYDETIDAPGVSGKNWYANSTPLHQTTLITTNSTFGTTSWTPTQDDEVKGVLSGATARVVEFNAASGGLLSLVNVSPNTSGGVFMDTEKIGRLRDSSGTTYDHTAVYITANGYVEDGVGTPIAHDGFSTVTYLNDLQPYTGEILYIENRSPITRSTDQSENIKIVIEF